MEEKKPKITEDEFEEQVASLENEIKKIVPKKLEILKRLAYEISIIGLSEQEACMVVNFDIAELIALRQKHEKIERLFKMKSLEYKRGLLKTLSKKAREGDEKLAQWLLEAKYGEEYNRRRGGGGNGAEGGEDMLGAAVDFIQKSAGGGESVLGSGGLVKKASGFGSGVVGDTRREVLPPVHEALKDRAEKIVSNLVV